MTKTDTIIDPPLAVTWPTFELHSDREFLIEERAAILQFDAGLDPDVALAQAEIMVVEG